MAMLARTTTPSEFVSTIVESPVGHLRVTTDGRAIVRITWIDRTRDRSGGTDEADHPLLGRVASQLAEYFAGKRHHFDVPVAPAGTAFQCRVWGEMAKIPWGETRTYGDLARTLDVAPQMIGQACGDNLIPIVIPCHRVVAADGKTGGFSGGRGVETKLALLRHEGALLL